MASDVPGDEEGDRFSAVELDLFRQTFHLLADGAHPDDTNITMVRRLLATLDAYAEIVWVVADADKSDDEACSLLCEMDYDSDAPDSPHKEPCVIDRARVLLGLEDVLAERDALLHRTREAVEARIEQGDG
jgi:hypothetical protein